MQKIELRDYQEVAVGEIKTALAQYKRILFQAATGSGKGVMLSSLAYACAAKRSRTLILCHRIEIVKQNIKQCKKWGLEVSIIDPKSKDVPKTCVAVGMAQTLQRRKDIPEWKEYIESVRMLIIDEAHTGEFDFIWSCISPNCFAVGCSATPVRYGNMRQLGLDYNAIVTGPSIKELIQRKFLCSCRLYAVDAPRMDDVEWDYGRGDYALGQMAAKFKDKAKYVGAVENYMRICPNKKCIVFCCSSEQTIELTKAFNAAGVSSKYVLSGSFDDDEDYSGDRDKVIKQFTNNEFRVLCNLGIGTTGLDIPDIEVVMLMFATTSVTKYLQCLGRASRIAPNKNSFICLDFGGNYERLGRYEDDREWSVWHSTSAGGGVPPVKECPKCHKMIPVQYQDCCFCGYHFPTQQEVYQAELQEIVAKAPEEAEETLEQYVARQKLAGKGNNWILVNVCIKNPEHKKEAFDRAIAILRSKHGEQISPKYWYFFSKNILSKVRVKEDKGPKLF